MSLKFLVSPNNNRLGMFGSYLGYFAVVYGIIMLTNKLINSENGSLAMFMVPAVIVAIIGSLTRVPILMVISLILSSPLFVFLRLSKTFDFIGLFPLFVLASAILIVSNRGQANK